MPRNVVGIVGQQWGEDFRSMQLQWPCWFSRYLRPRLVLLPHWWPSRSSGWAYLHVIFIAPGLNDAPTDARRFTLAHEYGHLQRGHTLWHLLYWLSAIVFLSGIAVGSAALKMVGAFLIAIVASVIILRARTHEYQADDAAVRLYGMPAALRGSLWLAEKNRTIDQPLRQSRLRRLGWDG